MHREPVVLESLAAQGEGYPLRTAVVGPTGADLDASYPADAPVLVLIHSFDSRYVCSLLPSSDQVLDTVVTVK